MTDQYGNATGALPVPSPALPDVDLRPVWSVVEVDHKLMHSTGPHAFQVMRVSDSEEAIDALLVKFAEAQSRWKAACASDSEADASVCLPQMDGGR